MWLHREIGLAILGGHLPPVMQNRNVRLHEKCC